MLQSVAWYYTNVNATEVFLNREKEIDAGDYFTVKLNDLTFCRLIGVKGSRLKDPLHQECVADDRNNPHQEQTQSDAVEVTFCNA